jgi:hypothetical protein
MTNNTFVLTAVDGEKIINIGDEPFVIPEGQEGSEKTVKLELEMLESDFEFLTQELVDSMVTWNMSYHKAWKSDEPVKFSEEDCGDMIELYRRLHAYFKPFLKNYELKNGNYHKKEAKK